MLGSMGSYFLVGGFLYVLGGENIFSLALSFWKDLICFF